MKRTQKRILAGSIGAAIVTVTAVALAGNKVTVPVHIVGCASGRICNPYAEGSIGDARAATDGPEEIGCDITGYSSNVNGGTGGVPSGVCWAVDASGTSLGCSWSGTSAATAVGAMTSLSLVRFSLVGGECIAIEVDNNSKYAPAVP